MRPTEIIVYRNPAEKMMWDFWMNLPIEFWYVAFAIIGLIIIFWIFRANRK